MPVDYSNRSVFVASLEDWQYALNSFEPGRTAVRKAFRKEEKSAGFLSIFRPMVKLMTEDEFFRGYRETKDMLKLVEARVSKLLPLKQASLVSPYQRLKEMPRHQLQSMNSLCLEWEWVYPPAWDRANDNIFVSLSTFPKMVMTLYLCLYHLAHDVDSRELINKEPMDWINEHLPSFTRHQGIWSL